MKTKFNNLDKVVLRKKITRYKQIPQLESCRIIFTSTVRQKLGPLCLYYTIFSSFCNTVWHWNMYFDSIQHVSRKDRVVCAVFWMNISGFAPSLFKAWSEFRSICQTESPPQSSYTFQCTYLQFYRHKICKTGLETIFYLQCYHVHATCARVLASSTWESKSGI